MLTIVGLRVEKVGGSMASISLLIFPLVATTLFTVELSEFLGDYDVTGF